MATNKHATIRYHALDRCFSNYGRKFFIEDLIIACNEAIYEFAGVEDGVKRRQVFDDITFMERNKVGQFHFNDLKREKEFTIDIQTNLSPSKAKGLIKLRRNN